MRFSTGISAIGLLLALAGCFTLYGSTFSELSCSASSSGISSCGGGATLCSIAIVVMRFSFSSALEMFQSGSHMLRTFQPSLESAFGRVYSRSSTDSLNGAQQQSHSMTASERLLLLASMTTGPTGMLPVAMQSLKVIDSFMKTSLICASRTDSGALIWDVPISELLRERTHSWNRLGFALASFSASSLVMNKHRLCLASVVQIESLRFSAMPEALSMSGHAKMTSRYKSTARSAVFM